MKSSDRSRGIMALIALSSAFAATGCPRRAVVPPPNSFPQNRIGGPPGGARSRPLGRSPSRPVPPPRSLPDNPWKPPVQARAWKHIVLHHTATDRGSVESIHAAHLKRKDSQGRPWKGIGYHFVIGNGNGMPDGKTESTFRWRTQIHGAHAGKREYNEYGIGIALVGNFEDGPPTKAQLRAVKRLVAVLKREYDIPEKNVVGHNDVRATACPGKYFPLAQISRAEHHLQFGVLPLPAIRMTAAQPVPAEDLQP